MRARFGRRRFAAESGSICARNVTEGLQVAFSILCALELVHQSDVFYSSVLQFYCVAQFSLCRSQ